MNRYVYPLGTDIRIWNADRLVREAFVRVFGLKMTPGDQNYRLLEVLISRGRYQRRARNHVLALAEIPGIDPALRDALIALYQASWCWAKACFGELGPTLDE